MKPILIVKAGTTFPNTARRFGDFDDWVIRCLKLTSKDVSVVEVFKNHDLPNHNSFSGVVLTGSHSMVTDHEGWSENLSQWIPRLIESHTPFFGICYGHQLISDAMGGDVGYHPKGREVGTVKIFLTPEGKKDPLFGSFPPVFSAHVTHSQTVLKVPASATVLANNEFENCHAIRFGPCAWGVQFHPEFSVEVMRAYLDEQRETLTAEGFNVHELKSQLSETIDANQLLRRFAALIDRN